MPTQIVRLEISEPLPPFIEGAEHYDRVQLVVFQHGIPVGIVLLANGRKPVSQLFLRSEITRHLGYQLAQEYPRFLPELKPVPDQHFSLSLVICTRDRPADLRRCLHAARMLQVGAHTLEIIVVDNNPASEQTPPVVADFAEVCYIAEPKPGVAYARNAGLFAAHGEIVAYIDDDVTVSPEWVSYILAPFADPRVMCVSGLVLPYELETRSQELFERYGGLGRGYRPRIFDSAFFNDGSGHVVHTWDLGGTANVALRKQVIAETGPFDETLGPGLPSGVGEDIYMFYRILKAGHLCYYEPAAYVWHKHRDTMAALTHQLYNYSKGQVSYQLRTLVSDGDRRVLRQLAWDLPLWNAKKCAKIVLGRLDYPLSLFFAEIKGNIVGPYAFIQSIRRHRQVTRSRRISG